MLAFWGGLFPLVRPAMSWAVYVHLVVVVVVICLRMNIAALVLRLQNHRPLLIVADSDHMPPEDHRLHMPQGLLEVYFSGAYLVLRTGATSYPFFPYISIHCRALSSPRHRQETYYSMTCPRLCHAYASATLPLHADPSTPSTSGTAKPKPARPQSHEAGYHGLGLQPACRQRHLPLPEWGKA